MADTSPPTVLFSDDTSGVAKLGTTVTYTLSFDEPVTGLDASDFLLTNGTLGAIAGSGALWTVAIVPLAGVASGNIGLTLRAGSVQDAAGNFNLVASDTSQAIDTQAPAAPWLVTGSAFKPMLDPQIVLHTNLGDVVLELNSAKAPLTVANMLAYANDGFFSDTIFHRVIAGFMVQGGGFTEGLIQKAVTYEPLPLESGNGLLNLRGAIAMARTNVPDSATAQFFVNHQDNAFLNYAGAGSPGYAVFGQVVTGMSVIDAIAASATSTQGGFADVPVTDIVILSVSQSIVGSTISNTGSFSVTGLENGGHFEYSLDGGGNWLPGSGSQFSVPTGNYAANAIQVRQFDAAGNVSSAVARFADGLNVAAGNNVSPNHAPVGNVVVSGVAIVGQTLSTSIAGVSDANGGGTLATPSYQWLRNGDDVVGANGSSYTLAAADIGVAISVRLRYTDALGRVETVRSVGQLTGDADANLITGSDLGDLLVGLGGDDTIDGGSGADTLDGGSGADLLKGGSGSDLLDGGDGADWLEGGSGVDTLNGGVGNDTLDGGTSGDSMAGGSGDDVYLVDSVLDVIVEGLDGGIDEVRTSVSYPDSSVQLTRLAANIEKLTLTGTAGIYGVGNSLDNTLTGNSGANTLVADTGHDTLDGGAGNDTLYGEGGNDVLIGGLGNDTMLGGDGNDTYYMDAAGDLVVESSADLAIGGRDRVVSSLASYTLGANVEDLELGSGALAGTGNSLNNALDGNALANTLLGLAGQDVLQGGAGDDTLVGGSGNDTLDGGADFDLAVFSGARAGYTISRGPGGITVVGADGTDLLSNIEKLQFDDGEVLLRRAESDFDGDGKSDILWRNGGNGQNTIWKSGSSATAQSVTTVADPAWKMFGSGDFNADGKADILWRNTSSGLNTVWLGGTSASAMGLTTLADQDWKVVGVGDFNADGVSDIVWRSSVTGQNSIWRSGSNLTAQAVTTVADANWQIVGVGDFDADGISDLLWRNGSSGVNTIWKGASNTSTIAVATLADTNWKVASLGDFNGDGKADILWRNSATGLNSIWRSGNGADVQGVTQVADLNWTVAGTGDYDGNGAADILWRNGASGQNVLWKSASKSQSLNLTTQDVAWSVAPYKTGAAPSARTAQNDFNGDGTSDMLWRNTATGVQAAWLGANNATAQGLVTLADQNWKVAGIGDFDGDKNSDILWRNTTTGVNTIWKSANNASGQGVTTLADQAWKIVGVGDFNGDGKADILWRNSTTGVNSIWNSGNNATAQSVATVADPNWKVVGVGDFNGDGSSDILWRNSTTGVNTIWKSGNSATAQGVTTLADMNWAVVGTGDYDGDGKADILWRNNSTGVNAIWKSANNATAQAVTQLADLNWSVVDGLDSGDLLQGGAGANTLYGTIRSDVITGGPGNDTMTGGPAADLFRYLASNQGVDSITDFLPGVDKIQLVSSGFASLPVGAVAANKLVSGAAPVANQAAAQFLYNTTSGMLAFDADGSGAESAVNLVTLVGQPAIAAADVVVVGT
jgi:cyclophilin family peptidyl-prolyl cis-trans isomerase